MSRPSPSLTVPLHRLLPALVLLTLLLAPGCGRKGAPQPPIKIQPRGSTALTSTQHGDSTTISWRLPKMNTDESDLVGLARVELFRYTDLLKPKDEDEEEEEGKAPMDYAVLDQVTNSFLSDAPGEEDEFFSAAGGEGDMGSGFGGQFAGGQTENSALGGSASSRSNRSNSSNQRNERDRWADSQQQRPPRETPGFRNEAGKFITARRFERKAELVHVLSGSQLSEMDTVGRLYHHDPLPELEEETRDRTRYHYAVRVLDTLGREGLFSDFLKVTPLDPPPAPTNLSTVSLEKSIDLAWNGPPVNPWARIAREEEEAAMGIGGEAVEEGSPAGGGMAKPGADGLKGKLEPGDGDTPGEEPLRPPEDAVVAGWLVQPPAMVFPAPGGDIQLDPLWPDPWPVGPRRPVPPYIAGYYVFRQLADEEEVPTLPTHAKPLVEPAYSNRSFAMGETYRYTVRTVLVTEDGRVESVDSEPVTVEAHDVYAPITPVNFTYVAAAGEVTLIWTANGEPDLLGYNVYRHRGTTDAPAGEAALMNMIPLEDPRFKDSTVQPGTWYTYRVEALDRAEPANLSEKSEPLQVMAR